MTIEQRTQQFWPLLAFAAREQRVVSHSLLSQLTGFPDTGIVLYYIDCYCKQHHLPPLGVIAIDPATGRPGESSCEVADLSAQQSRVFLYDWLKQAAPSEAAFKAVVAKDAELEEAEVEWFDVPCRC